jgi:fatty acid desaturase
VLGIAQGRCGWLMHEGGHNSLTGITKVDKVLCMFLYGFGVSCSGSYWMNQHNKHHATPQKLKYDTDLDTLPLVAFNKAAIRDSDSPLWLSLQAYLFLPLSTFLVGLGWKIFLHPRYSLRTNNWFELSVFALHYAAFVALFVPRFGFSQSLVMYLFYTWVTSGYIFGNFSLSHTHKPVVQSDEHLDWVRYAALETTNINPHWFVNWWMGYLNCQIEHHLFPTMPQFRQPRITKRVAALFAKHGVPYDSRGYFEMAKVTWQNLYAVGNDDAPEKKVSQAKPDKKKAA